jgi:hypothetical protein
MYTFRLNLTSLIVTEWDPERPLAAVLLTGGRGLLTVNTVSHSKVCWYLRIEAGHRVREFQLDACVVATGTDDQGRQLQSAPMRTIEARMPLVFQGPSCAAPVLTRVGPSKRGDGGGPAPRARDHGSWSRR